MDLNSLLGQIGGGGRGQQNDQNGELPLADTSEQIYISSLALIKMLKHGFNI